MIPWILVVVALVGTVLNVRGDRRGFLFWLVSNLGLAVMNALAGSWAQAALFAVYFGLAAWGWWVWKGRIAR
jgi:nicotinamide riboside transporter PnuC